jgi:hypothetical protein
MKPIYKLFLIVAISLAVSSCETIIDFNGEAQSPVMVLNSVINSDSVITVKLTKSKFFLSKNQEFTVVKNATVKAVINDSVSETLVHMGDGIYKSAIILKANDMVKITAEAPNLEAIQSQTLVQPVITILSVDTVWTEIKDNNNYYSSDIYNDTSYNVIGKRVFGKFKVFIKFKDNSDKQNFYRLQPKLVNYYSVNYNQEIREYESTFYAFFQYDDVLFGNTNNQSDFFEISSNIENNFFTDELINGKEYTLSFSFGLTREIYFSEQRPGSTSENNLRLKIDLQQLSKDYYLYQQTVLSAQSADPFFSEPVQVHNNIEGGIGILGSISNSIYSLDLKNYTSNYYYGYSSGY